MRYVLIAVVISAALYALCGCRATVTNKPVTELPEAKVTRTITETVKVEKPVPVYQTVTEIQTKTKTECSDGKCVVAPLHKTEIVGSKIPEPGK